MGVRIVDFIKVCIGCGKNFKFYDSYAVGARYCSTTCRNKSEKEQAREIYRKRFPTAADRTEAYKRTAKNKQMHARYGITLDDFENQLKEQNYTCVMCKTEITGTRQAHMDHCHTTGKIRQILCRNCNYGLGFFRDNIEVMQAGIEYIKRHSNVQ